MPEEATIGPLNHGLMVVARHAGEGRAPWRQPWTALAEVSYKYEVRVSVGDDSYTAEAWGSMADYNLRRYDCEGVAWMVLYELLSAAEDPDEFVTTWAEGLDRITATKLHAMADLLETAERMKPALEANCDAIARHAE